MRDKITRQWFILLYWTDCRWKNRAVLPVETTSLLSSIILVAHLYNASHSVFVYENYSA